MIKAIAQSLNSNITNTIFEHCSGRKLEMRAGTHTSRIIPLPPVRFNKKTRPFVDRVRILLASGRGGDGANIMGAVMNQEFAGPTGGNGGQGGSVFLRASNLYPDLHHVQSHGTSACAGAGRKGHDKNEWGSAGRHLILDVPVGTVVRDADTNADVCDLKLDGESFLVLEGGIGGKGNAAIKSSLCVSPVHATRGLPGNSLFANMELKLLADVALVGYPNAGKSSVLSAISTSRPEIAPYPFTTMHPYIGKLYSFTGESTCNVADLPGLIEGAYENRGLGHQFLQHVERSKLIALVVDMSESYSPPDRNELDGPLSPTAVIDTLIQELRFYEPSLPGRIAAVLCNKMDVSRDPQGVPLADKFVAVKKFVLSRLGPKVACFPVSANIALNPASHFVEAPSRRPGPGDGGGDAHPATHTGDASGQQRFHPRSSGLPAAVEFLTRRVFALQRREREAAQQQQRARDTDSVGLFAERNRSLFAVHEMTADAAAAANDGDDGDGADANGHESGALMDDRERDDALAKRADARRDAAVERLMYMRGRGPVASTPASASASASASSAAAARRREARGSKQGAGISGHFFDRSPRAAYAASGVMLGGGVPSLVDDQIGDDGFAAEHGPLASTWGGDTAQLASMHVLTDDPLTSMRRRGQQQQQQQHHAAAADDQQATAARKQRLANNRVLPSVLEEQRLATYDAMASDSNE